MNVTFVPILIPLAGLITLVALSALSFELIILSNRYGNSFRTVLNGDLVAYNAAVQNLQDQVTQNAADQAKQDEANNELRNRQIKKNKERERKREKKKKDKDEKEKRKNSFYGCVTMIIPLEGSATVEQARGFAIRIEAIKQNILSDDEVSQEIQKIVVGDNILPTVGGSLYCLEVYVHQLPSGISVGNWVDFEFDMTKATAASYTPVLPNAGNFDDGLAWLEVTSPLAIFSGASLSTFAQSNFGYKLTIDMTKFKPDVTKTALDKLRILFENLNPTRQNLTNFLRLAKVIPNKLGAIDQYKTADHYVMANVGQG